MAYEFDPGSRVVIVSQSERGFWSNIAGWVYDAESATVFSVDDALASAERLALVVADMRLALLDDVRGFTFDDGSVALPAPAHRLRMGTAERAL